MAKRKKDPLPENFSSLEEAADFWDTHDSGDYWKESKPVKFDIRIEEPQKYFKLKDSIANKLTKIARKKKTRPEALLNLWVQERLSKVA